MSEEVGETELYSKEEEEDEEKALLVTFNLPFSEFKFCPVLCTRLKKYYFYFTAQVCGYTLDSVAGLREHWLPAGPGVRHRQTPPQVFLQQLPQDIRQQEGRLSLR